MTVINDMNGMKKCCRCGKMKSLSEYYRNNKNKDGLDYHCKQCHNEYNNKYPQPPSYRKDYYSKNREEILRGQKDYCQTHPEVRKRASKKYRNKLKSEVLSHYSNGTMKCACEKCYYHNHNCLIEFLTIDHINNDGAIQRKKLNGKNIYLWLKQHNYPEGYQVLCMNCNFGKICNKGICPHKMEMEIHE